MEPHPLQQGTAAHELFLGVASGRRRGLLARLNSLFWFFEAIFEHFLSNFQNNIAIYLLQTYVRDIYPFRRSVSPQLNLVHMLPEKGQELIQKQV